MKPIWQRYWPAIVAALLAAGCFSLASALGKTQTVERRVPVVYLTKDLADPLQLIRADQLEVRYILPEAAPKDAFTSTAQVAGQYARYPLAAGTPLSQRLVANVADSRLLLAAALKPDERLVSVPVDLPGSVAALVVPGSLVDLTVVWDASKLGPGANGFFLSSTSWQNLDVVAVVNAGAAPVPRDGAVQQGQNPAERIPAAIVIKVRPVQAEQLAGAMKYGTLYASLRPPAAPDVPLPGYRGPLAPN